MPIVAPKTENKQFEIATEGPHVGVLADVIDLGVVTTDRGQKHRIRFLWLLDEEDSEGRQLSSVETFNLSANEASLLAKRVKSIYGQLPPADFDYEKCIGVCRLLIIQHNAVGDRTYANVTGVSKLPANMQPMKVPANFVRRKDRKQAA